MATNFFQQQAQARSMTARLVFLYCLAVVAIVASIVILAHFTMIATQNKSPEAITTFATPLHFLVGFAALAVIAVGTIVHVVKFGGDGASVASALGGIEVSPSTKDEHERRLVNVVEEMAIASGIPVPRIFVLPHESSINAFAAGVRPTQAVIGVTKGTLETLSRDELQGVVAHEFSHIFNGDMRLNIRLMGVLGGILFISTIGRGILEGTGRSRRYSSSSSSSSSSKKSDGAAQIMLLGVGLMAIGYIGVFFARLIKAAVSRQREFLADASAVQYTRNPLGIGGALLKIQNNSNRSFIGSSYAEEASHMFFGTAISKISGMLATHPPIDERLDRIAPGIKSQIKLTPQTAPTSSQLSAKSQTSPRQKTASLSNEEVELAKQALSGLAATPPPRVVPSPPPVPPKTPSQKSPNAVRERQLIETIGNPRAEDLLKAKDILSKIPSQVRSALQNPEGAQATALSLLLDGNNPSTEQQTALRAGKHDTLLMEAIRIRGLLGEELLQNRLALMELCCPSLRNLPTREKDLFLDAVKSAVFADNQQSIFEYVALALLEQQFGIKRKRAVATLTKVHITKDLSVALSALAYAGAREPAQAKHAFDEGVAALKGKMNHEPQFCPPELCKLPLMNEALERLSYLGPRHVQSIVDACQRTIWADKVVLRDELELFKAIGVVLQAPVPAAAGDSLVN